MKQLDYLNNNNIILKLETILNGFIGDESEKFHAKRNLKELISELYDNDFEKEIDITEKLNLKIKEELLLKKLKTK